MGHGWWIFDLPEADMGCHPSSDKLGQHSGAHHISFYCDNINETVESLRAKGVEFVNDITDMGYGFAILFKMPGEMVGELYQPNYQKAS